MFFIITGHPDTTQRKKVLKEISKRISIWGSPNGTGANKPEHATCYCTHYSDIPDFVYENFDNVIYTKNNPLLNWDINDSVTKTFGSQLKSFGKYDNEVLIRYPQIYHGYAHIISVCDGVILGANLGHTQFTMMNYDVIPECNNLIENHIESLKNNNAVFYYYGDDTLFNTEFFSFDLAFAMELYKLRDYNNYKKYKTILIERIIRNIVEEKKFKIDIKRIPFENRDNFGTASFGLQKDQLIIPYHEKYVENEKYKITILPYKDVSGHKLVIGPSNENIVNDDNFFGLEIFLNDIKVEMQKDRMIVLEIDFGDVMKIYDNKKCIRKLNFNDDRHFGYMKLNGELQ